MGGFKPQDFPPGLQGGLEHDEEDHTDSARLAKPAPRGPATSIAAILSRPVPTTRPKRTAARPERRGRRSVDALVLQLRRPTCVEHDDVD
jgi:hypothetical protein